MRVRAIGRSFLGARLRAWRAWSNRMAIVGSGDAYAKKFGQFGFGAALLAPQGVIYNEKYLCLGEGTMVGPHVALTAGIAPGQTMLSDTVVRIGDRTVIGRGSHIIGHWSIDIGSDVQTGPYVYITDQNHGYDDPEAPIGWQQPHEAAVRIGDGSWLGAHVVILPGTTLGRNTVVAAGAVVRGEFPDHVVLGGVPAKILKRYSPDRGWHTPETS